MKSWDKLPVETCRSISAGGAKAFSENYGEIYDAEDHKVLSLFGDFLKNLKNSPLPELQHGKAGKKLEMQEIINIAKNIAGAIDPTLLSRFEALIQENRLEIIKGDDIIKKFKRNASETDMENRIIRLDPFNNATDICIILHEFIHLEVPFRNDEKRFTLLMEIAPHVVELLAADALEQRGDVASNTRAKVCDVLKGEAGLRMLEFMDGWKQNGKVSEDSVREFSQFRCTPEELAQFGGHITPSNEYGRSTAAASYSVGVASAIVLVEKIKNKELDLQTVFAVLQNPELDEAQRLVELGINTQSLNSAVHNYVGKHRAKEATPSVDDSML